MAASLLTWQGYCDEVRGLLVMVSLPYGTGFAMMRWPETVVAHTASTAAALWKKEGMLML